MKITLGWLLLASTGVASGLDYTEWYIYGFRGLVNGFFHEFYQGISSNCLTDSEAEDVAQIISLALNPF